MTNDKVPAACQPELGEISRKPLRNINKCASLLTKGVLSLWAQWPSRVSGKSGEGMLRTDVCTWTSLAALTGYDMLTRKLGRWKMTWLHSWASDFQGLSDRVCPGSHRERHGDYEFDNKPKCVSVMRKPAEQNGWGMSLLKAAQVTGKIDCSRRS